MVVVSTLTPHREWRHGRMLFRSLRCCPLRILATRERSVWCPTTSLFPTGGFPGSSGHSGIEHDHRWWCEGAFGHGQDPLLIDPGRSTGSPILDTICRHKKPPLLHWDPTAEERQSLSVGSLPTDCLGQTLNALDWKLKIAGQKQENHSSGSFWFESTASFPNWLSSKKQLPVGRVTLWLWPWTGSDVTWCSFFPHCDCQRRERLVCWGSFDPKTAAFLYTQCPF